VKLNADAEERPACVPAPRIVGRKHYEPGAVGHYQAAVRAGSARRARGSGWSAGLRGGYALDRSTTLLLDAQIGGQQARRGTGHDIMYFTSGREVRQNFEYARNTLGVRAGLSRVFRRTRPGADRAHPGR
jgi:hypothetical protein